VVSATVAIVLAGLASLLAVHALSGTVAGPRRVITGPAAPRHSTAGLVTVQPCSLTGLPVAVVTGRLRQLGLVVDVQWQPTSLEPPGTVVSVQPAGKVPVGSIVTVTGALQPASATVSPGGDGGGTDGGGSDGGSDHSGSS
jgi:serine/threonine-protein kinase